MPAPGSDYSHGRHIAAVQAAARAAGVKGAGFAVLAYMCSAADFKRPTVRVAKATICARTGYHWDTVRIALRALRDLGLIHPISYATGGKHMATVYSLRTGKGVENPPGLETPEPVKGGGKSGQKGVENPVKRGWKFRPPSEDYSIDPSRVNGSASRAGIESTPLDEQSKQELALFSRECSQHGYTEAARRKDQREALRAGGGGL